MEMSSKMREAQPSVPPLRRWSAQGYLYSYCTCIQPMSMIYISS